MYIYLIDKHKQFSSFWHICCMICDLSHIRLNPKTHYLSLIQFHLQYTALRSPTLQYTRYVNIYIQVYIYILHNCIRVTIKCFCHAPINVYYTSSRRQCTHHAHVSTYTQCSSRDVCDAMCILRNSIIHSIWYMHFICAFILRCARADI